MFNNFFDFIFKNFILKLQNIYKFYQNENFHDIILNLIVFTLFVNKIISYIFHFAFFEYLIFFIYFLKFAKRIQLDRKDTKELKLKPILILFNLPLGIF